ncbi:hypothetical protein COU54_04970 [Candidatus Pacearchaeota archaeon CG10_big_fil_rev_8_21_14_0_10_31_24]|nr:MAG: hypothetical protein COU54_04970 [Candidatus Pacearchaeota archaeon CG10_big_fil_rev_8_21_14_0_10_31_24]
MIRKKGQEEIVGFVVIVVIVSVIIAILLGIVISKDKSEVSVESEEIYQFLESFVQTTSKCALTFEPDYATMGEIINECYSDSGKSCSPSNEKVCSYLNSSLKEILEDSWPVGKEYSNKGYIMNIDYVPKEDSISQPITTFFEGNCSLQYLQNEYSLRESKSKGNLEISLKICV